MRTGPRPGLVPFVREAEPMATLVPLSRPKELAGMLVSYADTPAMGA